MGISKDLSEIIATCEEVVGPEGKIQLSIDTQEDIGEHSNRQPSAKSCARL